MKPWMKWAAAGLVLALLAAGTLRTLSARQAKQAALAAQQLAQQTQVSISLDAADVVQVRSLLLNQVIELSGPVRAVNTAWVKAKVPGELRDLVVHEGDAVHAGQVLARIDPTDSQARLNQARQQVAAAKAQQDIAQRSFDNNRALVAQGFISSTALESSQATLAAAQANQAALQASADLATKALDDTLLRASISGQISQRLVQNGERVAIDTRVLELVNNQSLELDASVNAADAAWVKVGQDAQLSVEGSTQPFAAKVARLNPSASLGSRALLVYLALAPNTPLRHGMFAQGKLHVGSTQALALPLTAVRTDKPQPYVQLIAQGKVVHTPVALGVRGEFEGQTMVAVSDVAEGSQVIASQVGSLRAGTLVQVASTGVR
ncbi:efflux RND transporter periplasmic adaptor subunit [Rhodoferax sp.]|uniref:efflux RND transporter periplasmic adaptor subunit n=1 Tax=Rhodoferax sp. TaxID=50421 RepID=UPI00262D8A06|nr:efflux RND transporter periplasmic adaptor subunit [Rhodoferax sp.]MDD5480327.1 efflux RND transporter periplasmic adaptor subunit [Rhodoferax sp.]